MELVERSSWSPSPPGDGEGREASREDGKNGEGGMIFGGLGYDEGGTVRRNAAAHLNQIGAEIQLTAALRYT